MRKLLLLLALLPAACGPRRETGVPRYSIVTTIPEDDPLHREIEALAALRWAEIFHVAAFAPNAPQIEDWLRDRAPDFVAAVVRPADVTPAEVRALVDVLCRLDADPFPDAALGWFVATDVAFLRRQIQTLRGAEAKVEKRLLQTTAWRNGPASDRSERLEWADGLPLRRLEAPAGDVAFLRERLSALTRCDYLLLGAPPLRGLRLDSAVVFSELPGSANPYKPWLADLLQAGAAGVFAPLGDERAGDAEREWADAIVTDEDLGEVWRRSAETAVLSGRSPAARLLFGCPLLDVYHRPARPLWTQVSARLAGADLEVVLKVVSWDISALFFDESGGQRLHVRLDVPPDTRRLAIAGVRAEAQGRAVELAAPALALERREDVQRAHVLLRGPRLAVEDLFITIRLRLE